MKRTQTGIAMQLIDVIRKYPIQATVFALSLGYLLRRRLRRQSQAAATYRADGRVATSYGSTQAERASATSSANETRAANSRAADALANELLYGTDADFTDGIGIVEAGLRADDTTTAAEASSVIDVFADDATRTAGADALQSEPGQHDRRSDIPEMTDLPSLDPATLAEISSVMSNDDTLLTESGMTEDRTLDQGRAQAAGGASQAADRPARPEQ